MPPTKQTNGRDLTVFKAPDVVYDPLRALIGRLEELGSYGRGRRWQCPAHADREPSLSVTRHRNGRDVVFYCHAGCSDDEVRIALGWEWSDFYSVESRPVTRDVPPSLYRNVYSCNTSSCNREGPRPDLRVLEDEYRRGERDFVPARIGEVPDDAGILEQAVADDVARISGLFASVGEYRPLPYSARFGAKRLGVSPMAVCRALKRLVAWGVLPDPISLEPRNGQARGTLAFPLEPEPLGLDEWDLGELSELNVEVSDQEPVAEVADESKVLVAVDRKVRESSTGSRMIAARNATGIVHRSKSITDEDRSLVDPLYSTEYPETPELGGTPCT